MSRQPMETGRIHGHDAVVLLAVRDVAALRRLAGTVAFLSTRKFFVRVVVDEDGPGRALPSGFSHSYPRVSVRYQPLPAGSADGSAAAILTRSRITPHVPGGRAAVVVPPPFPMFVEGKPARLPAAVLVSRLGGGRHHAYIRAARRLGVPSVYVVLDSDDVSDGELFLEQPDYVVVWNASQRRLAVECGVPIRRTCVIGSPLETDVLAERFARPRDQVVAELGLAPGQPFVLVDPPGVGARPQADPSDRIHVRLSTLARAGAVPVTVSRVPIPLAESGVKVLCVPDEYRYALALHELLASASGVMSTDSSLLLEAIARGVPTIIPPSDGRLDWAHRLGAATGWPRVTSGEADLQQVVSDVLAGAFRTEGLIEARGEVRPHGFDVEPGLLMSRIVRDIRGGRADRLTSAEARQPIQFEVEVAKARDSEPVASPGLHRVLVATPSVAAFRRWEPLFEELVRRGHRIVSVFAGPDPAIDWDGLRELAGVTHAGAVTVANEDRELARTGVAIRLLGQANEEASEGAAKWWRRKVVTVPPPLDRLMRCYGRGRIFAMALRLGKAIHQNLPLEEHVVGLIRREAPTVVLAIPALEEAAAIESWAIQGALERAAAADGIPVVTAVFGTSALGSSLAQCALRPHGLNRGQAVVVAGELEAWLGTQRGDVGERERVTPVPLLADLAGTALAALTAVAPFLTAVSGWVRNRQTSSDEGVSKSDLPESR